MSKQRLVTINENDLARSVCRLEGKKVSVDIGQVKEVIRCTLEELAGWPASSIMALVEKHDLTSRTHPPPPPAPETAAECPPSLDEPQSRGEPD